ncbi:hypothetical protein, partial [Rhizobium sp. BK529]|uniref:hypothetical protein n=1 Tax=Rhizobium sp. BK529 TaxID=2586983 RepID=UPI001AEDBB1E
PYSTAQMSGPFHPPEIMAIIVFVAFEIGICPLTHADRIICIMELAGFASRHESVDLVALRSYSYLNLKTYGDASRFRDCARNRDAARSLRM